MEAKAIQDALKIMVSEEMGKMVNEAPQNNFFMYAFIIFAFLMIIGFIVVIYLLRKPMDNIGNALRELSQIITQSETEKKAENEKFSILFAKLDSNSAERQKTDDSLFQAFRELSGNAQNQIGVLQAKVDTLVTEIRNLKENCQMKRRDEK